MKRLTIREASEILGRAPATIRRYIKSGRLPADQEQGKFGVEYKIKGEDLQELGLVKGEALARRETASPPSALTSLTEEISQRFVPRGIFNDLTLKHERLLVQYGMLRAGGQKLLEYRAEVDMKDSLLSEREKEIREMRERSEKEIRFLQNHLRQAEIEIEDRNIEITQLRERIKRFEVNLAGAQAVRSFDEAVRSAGGVNVPESRVGKREEGRNREERKIGLLQDWLRACEAERERGKF